jgi:hypothetical protein
MEFFNALVLVLDSTIRLSVRPAPTDIPDTEAPDAPLSGAVS